MKKLAIASSAFILILASCGKENLIPENQGYKENVIEDRVPVSVVIGQPDLENLDEAVSEDTKVTGIDNGTKTTFSWTQGDKLTLFAFDNNAQATSGIQYCGQLTAQSSGSKVTFSGSLINLTGQTSKTKLFVIANIGNSNPEDIGLNWSSPSYTINNVYMSPEQDGSGFPFCHFITNEWTLKYDEGIPSFDNTTDNLSLANAVVKLNLANLNAKYNIKKIVAMPDMTESTAALYPVGNLGYRTSQKTINSSGADSRYISIQKKDEKGNVQNLPDVVYFSMRRSLPYKSGSTTYGACYLYLYIYYTAKDSSEEKLAVVKKLVPHNENKLSESAIKDNCITVLPQFPGELTEKNVIVKEWSCGGTAPEPAEEETYTYFPYVNNSKYYKGNTSTSISSEEVKSYFSTTLQHHYSFIDGFPQHIGITTTNGRFSIRKSDNELSMYYTYLEIPAVSDYKLFRVDLTTSATTRTSVSSILKDYTSTSSALDNFKSMYLGGDYKSRTIYLPTAEKSTPYYLYIGKSTIPIESFKFYYQRTPDPSL